MPSSEIKYTTRADETFDGYLTMPDGDGPFPGILLITAIFGVDQEMKELADAWADDGFIVSVPDIFWRVLPGPTADMEVAFDRYGKFDFDKGMMDIEDLMTDLRGRPECNGKVAVLGFCFGGRYAHLAAARFGADAAASYHGTKIEDHLDETPNVKCPVSFHFGDADQATSVEAVEKIKEAYADHANAEIVLHTGGVGHNFAMPYKPGYDEGACKASREATLRCFRSM
jgi:carboxymethylenebutenolidase